jgi:thymidylate synthase
MTNFDIQYRNLVEEILSSGNEYLTRATDPITGKQLKAKKLFKRNFSFDLQEEFPILTTKQMPKSKTHPENGFLFASELFWIWVLGSNTVQDLRDIGNNVWNEWEIKEGIWTGTVGPTYGWQARQLSVPKISRNPAPMYTVLGDVSNYQRFDVRYEIIDQVQNLINGLINNPQDRGHIVTFWSPEHLPEMGLRPCAFQTIWDVDGDRLNCHLIQRSGDVGLGVPFNVSQYALLVHMIANVVGLKAGTLEHDITNAHIYENHYPQMEILLNRKPMDSNHTLWVNPDVKNFSDYKLTDIRIENYVSHGPLKMKVGV